jgi:hypothetical protein
MRGVIFRAAQVVDFNSRLAVRERRVNDASCTWFWEQVPIVTSMFGWR